MYLLNQYFTREKTKNIESEQYIMEIWRMPSDTKYVQNFYFYEHCGRSQGVVLRISRTIQTRIFLRSQRNKTGRPIFLFYSLSFSFEIALVFFTYILYFSESDNSSKTFRFYLRTNTKQFKKQLHLKKRYLLRNCIRFNVRWSQYI